MTEEAIENVLRDARATWRKAAERDERVVRAASERRLRDVRPRNRAPYVAAGLALAVILLWFGVRETRGPVVAVAIEPDPSSVKPAPAMTAESPAASVVPASAPSATPRETVPAPRPAPTVSALPPLPPLPVPVPTPPVRSRLRFRSEAADAVGSARIATASAELERGKVDAARERLRQIIDTGAPSSVVNAASLLATTYDAPADKVAVWDRAIPHLADGTPQRAQAERARSRLLVRLVRDGGS